MKSFGRLVGPTVAAWVCASAVLGCSLIKVDPVMREERDVVVTSNPAKTISFKEPSVWLDHRAEIATKGVRLPAGEYVLEAEEKWEIERNEEGPCHRNCSCKL